MTPLLESRTRLDCTESRHENRLELDAAPSPHFIPEHPLLHLPPLDEFDAGARFYAPKTTFIFPILLNNSPSTCLLSDGRLRRQIGCRYAEEDQYLAAVQYDLLRTFAGSPWDGLVEPDRSASRGLVSQKRLWVLSLAALGTSMVTSGDEKAGAYDEEVDSRVDADG
ncbi:hypothetical protein K525DRAFT_253106 [Schizophyllum commune Loenen D]|nr:hypothetical protein K525DRAFT_253106 [Schizophyllum commune Loenen D]